MAFTVLLEEQVQDSGETGKHGSQVMARLGEECELCRVEGNKEVSPAQMKRSRW
jgi:hypothetical protein